MISVSSFQIYRMISYNFCLDKISFWRDYNSCRIGVVCRSSVVRPTLTVSRKLFQYSDWILKRILYVFQPKESDYEVKNIQKIRDRGPYWPGMSIFAIFAFFNAVFGA